MGSNNKRKIGNATSNVYVKPGQTTSNVGINGGSVVVPPTVFSVSPSNNATGVPINTTITATFDRDMDPTTITTSTLLLRTLPIPCYRNCELF